MPFQSEAQRRYLWQHEPAIAHRWAHEYGTPRDLPTKKQPDRDKAVRDGLLKKMTAK